MKLTKAYLIKLLKPEMEELGFCWFKDSISGAQALFSKKIQDKMYLTAGMTIHRYYDYLFTVDFYLSKTTTIYSTWGDIPKDCMRRPNKSDEKFGMDSGRQEGWWSSKEALDDFISTVRRTEIELCLNVDLMNRINCSKDVNTLYTISSSIKRNIGCLPNIPYSFVPEREIDNIPQIWFKSAEWTLRQMGKEPGRRNVRFYASDAYRQHILDAKFDDYSFNQRSLTHELL